MQAAEPCSGAASAMTPADLVRKSFADFFEAMHQGRVAEWAGTALAEDFRYVMRHPDTGVQETRGRDAYCHHYNTVVRDYWGGSGSRITYRPESFKQLEPDRVRCAFQLDVARNPQLSPELPVLPGAAAYTRSIIWDVTVAGDCLQAWDLWVQTTQLQQGEKGGNGADCRAEPISNVACGHNDWLSVRVKRGLAIMRCRQCGDRGRVRMASEWALRCPDHLSGSCAAGSRCQLLHVLPPPRDPETGAAAERDL
eukprot:TRINITY_DN66117_c0_g1_i1.p2 TRINITY_DN66117_c0_g1~~TRINITY_DN66117_c0_g1_i1.p2  ORF type:complete len:283 (+),score=77.42 TRINITY_DN66117_c0_g1_i1:92-850(+)